MSSHAHSERPVGVYLVALYFLVAGFLESIQKYRESETPFALSPFAQHSIWELGVHTTIYLVIAYLIWNYAALGRLAALVFGYLMLGTYVALLIAYLLHSDGDLKEPSQLYLMIAAYHLVALGPIVYYLQPARRKKLFDVSLVELILSSD